MKPRGIPPRGAGYTGRAVDGVIVNATPRPYYLLTKGDTYDSNLRALDVEAERVAYALARHARELRRLAVVGFALSVALLVLAVFGLVLTVVALR